MDDGGVYSVPGHGDKDWKHEHLMTSLTKTLAEQQKTVALLTDAASQEGYSDFAGFLKELKLTRSLSSAEEAVEAAGASAVEHNLTICHVQVQRDFLIKCFCWC